MSLGTIFRVAAILAMLVPLATANSHDDLCVDVLPAEAEAVLQKQFPALYPEKVSDLSAEYRDAWISKHPQECPGIAVGHFLSAGAASYAVLLIGSKGGLSGSTLVVASKSGKSAWKLTKVSEEKVAYHYEAVIKVPASTSSGGLQRIQLKELDGGASKFYWSGGRFHRVAVRE